MLDACAAAGAAAACFACVLEVAEDEEGVDDSEFRPPLPPASRACDAPLASACSERVA